MAYVIIPSGAVPRTLFSAEGVPIIALTGRLTFWLN